MIASAGCRCSELPYELNQPLAAIANYLQGRALLKDSPDTRAPLILDALDKAAEQAVRAGVIQRLRDFSLAARRLHDETTAWGWTVDFPHNHRVARRPNDRATQSWRRHHLPLYAAGGTPEEMIDDA